MYFFKLGEGERKKESRIKSAWANCAAANTSRTDRDKSTVKLCRVILNSWHQRRPI